MSKGSNFFSVIVIGDEPEEMIEKYDNNLEVDKYLKYKYLDAEKMQKNSIKILNELVKSPKNFNLTEFYIKTLKDELSKITKMTPFEYYSMVTQGLFYDENGDAWDDKNQNGKYDTCRIGRNLSIPFKLKDGSESFSCNCGDVDWEQLHMNNTHVYEVVWEMIKEGKIPETEKEKVLYENMKDKDNYFSRFKDKDEYVVFNCAYWNYAILTEDGWFDVDDSKNEIEWISTFYDKFIAKLKPTDKITVFECSN